MDLEIIPRLMCEFSKTKDDIEFLSSLVKEMLFFKRFSRLWLKYSLVSFIFMNILSERRNINVLSFFRMSLRFSKTKIFNHKNQKNIL